LAVPASDFHSTSLDLYAVQKLQDGNRFAVEVVRSDELYDNEDSLIGTKDFDVIMTFDVLTDGLVTLNGNPVPMGISEAYFEAGTIIQSESDDFTAEELEDSFDIGVVGADIMAVEQWISDPFVGLIHRIAIAERIFELNGSPVAQRGLGWGNNELVEEVDDEVEEEVSEIGQVFDIYPDGSFVRIKACPHHIASVVIGIVEGSIAAEELENIEETKPKCKLLSFSWHFHILFLSNSFHKCSCFSYCWSLDCNQTTLRAHHFGIHPRIGHHELGLRGHQILVLHAPDSSL
jgi:hypothetical protein